MKVAALVACVACVALSGCVVPSQEPAPEPTPAERACNGLPALCDRSLDEVSFLRTHNSHASEERGYSQLSWNHYFAVPTQLADGVRALNFDVYLYEDEMVVCHGYCSLGSQPLLAILAELTAFLAGAPDEVVLLSLQNEAPWPDTLAALDAAGIAALGYAHTPGEPWPSLAEMLDGGTPLLVSAGGIPGDAPAWLHREGDLQWGDHWGAETPEDLDCEAENEAFEGGLYFFNNVLTAPIASPSLADQVNHDPGLTERLLACEAENGHIPNIVSVDFYSVGDTVAAVRALNARER